MRIIHIALLVILSILFCCNDIDTNLEERVEQEISGFLYESLEELKTDCLTETRHDPIIAIYDNGYYKIIDLWKYQTKIFYVFDIELLKESGIIESIGKSLDYRKNEEEIRDEFFFKLLRKYNKRELKRSGIIAFGIEGYVNYI